ncbi:glycosyltransferase [Nocardia wallacei]|uniref:glycosyltransferase n=1 Tax=Nocardia wallacei TaxID=480035 RepID=UPI002453C260|nr:glycosyltransferase [Nocardia wallacei]
MRLGLIARAENTGLGIQTWEFHRHMQPAKTLVVQPDRGRVQFPERFPRATFIQGFPHRRHLEEFVDGLDVVFTAETPYNYDLFTVAHAAGVATVLQYNFEFLDYLQRRDLPRPDVLAAPSVWHYNDADADGLFPRKVFLPVPIALDRFPPRHRLTAATRFLHIVGRPAIHDRNGTGDLLTALAHVRSHITLTIRSQDPEYVSKLLRTKRLPSNVRVELGREVENYWDAYLGHDVLVMPRRFGGLCLPAQESLGAGMPVIMPDISPNETMCAREWLVPVRRTGEFRARSMIDLYTVDHRALAAKIDQFATDLAFFRTSQDAARALADDLSWQRRRPDYVELFDTLLAHA